MKRIQLQPGELALTREAAHLQTILGSCVAFTMRHPETGLAGMSHCLLARTPTNKAVTGRINNYAYVDGALDEMLSFFRKAGVAANELEVKLFGGADVVDVLSGPNSVGQENIKTAQHLIIQHGLTLAASDIGGRVGRKIVFATQTGGVKVHKMQTASARDAMMAQVQASLAYQAKQFSASTALATRSPMPVLG